jgi:hypothetical protein
MLIVPVIFCPIRRVALRKTEVHLPILICCLALALLTASGAEAPKSVFIHGTCDGKISSAALSSLREELRASHKYQLVGTLDERPTDLVLMLYVNCTEHDDVGAIAFAFGQAKCFGSKNCRAAVDGSSVRSALCDWSATAECGRALFKAFDEYVSRPNPAPLKLN